LKKDKLVNKYVLCISSKVESHAVVLLCVAFLFSKHSWSWSQLVAFWTFLVTGSNFDWCLQGVSVEAVDPVFQAKMLDMLKQTGRSVSCYCCKIYDVVWCFLWLCCGYCCYYSTVF